VAEGFAADLPLVSVIVPVLNEERYLAGCLESVLAQTYPRDRIEIIVVDGGSVDGTRDIVRRLAITDSRLRLIDNPDRVQAAGLNRGLEAARGDVIARLDGHAALRPEHVERCVRLLADTGADNVGGGMEVGGGTPLAQAIGCATASPFGVGDARYRWASDQQDVETVWLGCFRRATLERVGRYDENLDVHEDYELNHRIRAAGGRVLFSPDLTAVYRPRESLRALARQYFRYGRAKARVARITPGVMRPHHVVPPLAVAAVPVVAGLTVAKRMPPTAALLAAGVYATGACGAALLASRDRPWSVRSRVPFVFPVLHGAWGLGFWAGLLEKPGNSAARAIAR
jgi:succinoglycan biosynthesis protein ExoA